MASFAATRYSPHAATVVHIGSDWTSSNRDNSMPAQTLTSRSASSAWTDNRTSSSSTAASRPTSRYSDRASSAASNVSLKDTIDVFVEDHFLKSYNLQYEPVRIRIGNDAPGAGNLYQSQPSFPGGTNSDWNLSAERSGSRVNSAADRDGFSSSASSKQNGGYAMKSSYRENTKTTTTSHGSPTIVSVGTPDNYSNDGAASARRGQDSHFSSAISTGNQSSLVNSTRKSRLGNPANEFSTPIGQEYSVPIQREPGAGYSRSGSVTIPISRENGDYPASGRQTAVFSPDSGRGSVDLPLSRLGEPTPLPATPIGRQTSIGFSSPRPGYEDDRTFAASRAGATPFPRRQKNVEFSDSPSSGRQTAQLDDSPYRHQRNGNVEPVSANFSVNGGTGVSVNYSEPKSRQPTRKSNVSSSPSRQRSQSPADFSGISLGNSKQFSINKADLARQGTPPPLHNATSLTYAMDARPSSRNSDAGGRSIWPNSPIPPAPVDHMRPSSRNRSLSRGDSTVQRPSSRVGLPSYDRDYVDKSEDDSDLDDLSDEERNERLQQKKLIFPQSRNAALMAELKETTSNISASRRGRKEQAFCDSMEKKALSAMLDRFTAEQFIPQVPYYDEEGFPIAEYKRIFLAKQAANQARREFQARINAGEQIEDVAQSAEWKKLFIDGAKEEYDGAPFKLPTSLPMGQKDVLQIKLNKSHAGYGSKLQPWQMELKRLERFNE